MGFRQERNATGMRRFWPLMGFLMFVALAIVSYFLAPSAIDLARGIVPGFRGNEMPPDLMRLAFAALVFVVLGSLAAIILAVTAPKREIDVIKDSQLLMEREEMLKRRAADRERLRRINRELRSK